MIVIIVSTMSSGLTVRLNELGLTSISAHINPKSTCVVVPSVMDTPVTVESKYVSAVAITS